MECETCRHYAEHPFIREGDKADYCYRLNEKISDIDTYLCDYHEHADKY